MDEEGFELSTSWFVTMSSNPMSYRLHPVSTGFVLGVSYKKTFPLLSHLLKFLRKVACYEILVKNDKETIEGKTLERINLIGRSRVKKTSDSNHSTRE